MKFIKIFFAIFLFSFTAKAQEQSNYSLPKCLETVLQNSYSIKFSRNQSDILSNNATRGNAGMLPTITANASAGGALNQQMSTGGNYYTNTHSENFSAGINGSWTLFEGFKTLTSYERLQEIKKNGELSTKLEIESSIAQATAMYYDIVQRNQKLSNLDITLDLSRERLRLAREKYLVGSRSQVELLQAQVDFNADSSQYVTFKQSITDLEIRFKKLLLLPFENDIVVSDTNFQLNEHIGLNELIDLSQKNNTSLKIYATNRSISELERKQVTASRYPYINLNASYGYNKNQANYNNSTSDALGLTYGVNVGFKIYDGLNLQRQIANLKINELNKQLEYEQQQQQVLSDIYLLYSSYNTYVHLLDLERQNKIMASKKIELAMELYRLGQITSLELREHQKTNLDAQDRLVNAMYLAKLSEIYLKQLCGSVMDYLNK